MSYDVEARQGLSHSDKNVVLYNTQTHHITLSLMVTVYKYHVYKYLILWLN